MRGCYFKGFNLRAWRPPIALLWADICNPFRVKMITKMRYPVRSGHMYLKQVFKRVYLSSHHQGTARILE